MDRSRSPLWPGQPYPLGATWDGAGVNFALFSEHATGVELCLFDRPDAATAREQVALRERTDLVWHGYMPGLGSGQLYGYRVHGPYAPEQGLCFNPAKLLIDPYTRAVAGELEWTDEVFGYRVGDPSGDLSRDDRDSAAFVPKSVVIDPAFDWEGDQLPRIPWHRSIVYEAHVKGFTIRHPDVPEQLRGTYAGLASPPALEHFTELGITAVELLPVHHHVDEHNLVRRGLRLLVDNLHCPTCGQTVEQAFRAVSSVAGVTVNRASGVAILAILGFMIWYTFGPEPRLVYALIVAVTA